MTWQTRPLRARWGNHQPSPASNNRTINHSG